jgi:hypothetical protein
MRLAELGNTLRKAVAEEVQFYPEAKVPHFDLILGRRVDLGK